MAGEAERAYQKCLYMLERRDYTESELRRKLKIKEFEPEAIDGAILRLKEYGFVNDRRFAEQYLRYHYTEYSRKMLSMKLLQKGIKAEMFDEVYEQMLKESDDSPEREALCRVIETALRKAERKGLSRYELPADERNRIIASAYRKGFSVSQINSELIKAVEQ